MSTTKLVIIVGQGKFAESLLHEIPMLAKASGQKILTQAYGKRLERGSPTLIIHAVVCRNSLWSAPRLAVRRTKS